MKQREYKAKARRNYTKEEIKEFLRAAQKRFGTRISFGLYNLVEAQERLYTYSHKTNQFYYIS